MTGDIKRLLNWLGSLLADRRGWQYRGERFTPQLHVHTEREVRVARQREAQPWPEQLAR